MVTVESAPLAASSRAWVMPTLNERPMTTAFFPESSMLAHLSMRMTPAGVQGIIPSKRP